MLPDPFAVMLGGAEEVRADAGYFHDNGLRGDPDRLVIQRTVAGAGFLEDTRGRHPVPAGHAMLFTHREPTRYGYPPGAAEPYRLRFVAFSPAGIRALFDRVREEFGPVVRMPEDGEATALHDELLTRFRTRSFRDRWHESELLYRLMIALCREQVDARRARDPVEFGHHYLQHHFRSPINLKQVAERCGISREHFIRGYRERYHEPPGGALRRLRLDYARELLAATELAVEEVAVASGFAGGNTFCRAYRRRFGNSPGRDRARLGPVSPTPARAGPGTGRGARG